MLGSSRGEPGGQGEAMIKVRFLPQNQVPGALTVQSPLLCLPNLLGRC